MTLSVVYDLRCRRILESTCGTLRNYDNGRLGAYFFDFVINRVDRMSVHRRLSRLDTSSILRVLRLRRRYKITKL